MLTAAGTLVAVPQADAAALFYWQDSDPGYYRPAPVAQPRKPKVRRPSAKTEAALKETNAKPQGPLIIAVSIEQQKVRVYDANGLFAESPVSTGMKGHSTPMGVFSIIQKHKMHRSNIYSGAPMPYMQRITWSGVAMHAGVLPGYPASHGCIRMPTAFAVKMWNWTRMGARVIITPGQITPASFSHPLLVAQKVVPQPLLADDPANDAPAVKSDKGADAGHANKLANSEAGLDLRSTVGHAAPLREQTHTADARAAMPAMNDVVSDATPSAAKVQPASDTSNAEAKADTPKSEPADAADVKSAESAAESVKAEDIPGEAKVETSSEMKSDALSAEASTAAITNVEEAKTPESKTPESKPAESKAAESKALEKPTEPVKAVADAPAVPAVAPDVKKDTARPPGAAAKAEPPRRPGQIAVFVSRKDSKLYVRENFKPQFDVPITIAPSDRPLGTHVFTAEADKKDPNLLRWSVVSLPVTARNAARTDEDDRTARRRKVAGGALAEARPLPMPNSPAEALDRITVAPEAMARIAEVLTTGGSIVVSDHGVNQGGETGEGTDFIVPLR
ncbi:L,D-transpeptidase family protein [Bradyrhizobium algeriense]|uniref:L,D-transpeptidase family protein n=1 Tax=Bradyrhizobium algeriense TaxID=634784 RepID=UPI000D36F899|nr:L,D-transpeptidase family protein [Bradyrhizobium algeriense]